MLTFLNQVKWNQVENRGVVVMRVAGGWRGQKQRQGENNGKHIQTEEIVEFALKLQ